MPFNPEATYSVDEGDTSVAWDPGFQPLVDNVTVTWTIDPLPADAKELTFTITDLDRWPGPWEFRIQLDDGA
jgi:hypothetical protein